MNYSKKVLVTGATGLIGKELAKPLQEEGFDVYALTIDENNVDNGIHWIKGDLFDKENIKLIVEKVKPEYLLNMAWATTGDYLKSDINYKFLNAGINILEHFKDNGGRRAVFAGTCFEYKFKDEPLKETDALQPEKNTYAFCKNKLREITEYFCNTYGISFGYGRIFYVYGRKENKTRLTGMILDKLLRDEEVIIKSGHLFKDYMYAKDIAEAFVKFLSSNVEGPVNICTGRKISIKDFVLEIARQIGKEHLVIFKDEPSNQPLVIVGDNSKLVNEVGYNLKYDLRDSIAEIIEDVNAH